MQRAGMAWEMPAPVCWTAGDTHCDGSPMLGALNGAVIGTIGMARP